MLGGCDGSQQPADRTGASQRFAALYGEHCAACHGVEGWNGPAVPLANPVYLAWADDGAIRQAIAAGRPATGMPAFAREAGGPLGDDDIEVLVAGMRSSWAKPIEGADDLPPYAATPSAGIVLANDIVNGAAVYVSRCLACHEPQGVFKPQAERLRDPTYLALVSDQGLRTAVVAGRPDLGMPDWRGDARHPRLLDKHIWEVGAYLASFRKPRR